MIVFFIGIFLFACCIALYIYFANKNNHLEEKKKKHRFSNRKLFMINLTDQTVEWFDLNNIQKKTTITFVDFIKLFDVRKQNEVRNWVSSIDELDIDVDSNDASILTSMYVHKDVSKRGIMKTLLYVESINKDKRCISINAIMLPHIPISARNKKVKNHETIYLISELQKSYDNGAFEKGNFHIIKLKKKPNVNISQNEGVIRDMIVEYVYRVFTNVDIYLSFYGDEIEIIVIDNRLMNVYQLSKTADDIKQKVSEYLEIQGIKSIYSLIVVSSRIDDLKGNFTKAHELLSKVANTGIDDGKSLFIYYPQTNEVHSIEENYKVEINKVLRNQSIDIYFIPIINVNGKKLNIIGYTYDIRLKDSNFKDYEDLKKHALQYDLSKDVFSFVSKKIISTFVSQKADATFKLVYPIELSEIPYANRSFPHINGLSDASIVFLFKNNEFIDSEDDDDSILRRIKNLQAKGYECGLIIEPDDYSLKESTYRMFDSFYFNFAKLSNLKQTSRDFIKAHTQIVKCVKFYKPIVCYNVENLPSVELLLQSGVTYVSSPSISPESTMLLPLDKKVIKKLITMK